jgi:ADP-heptose:LPS heptosyltransferase
MTVCAEWLDRLLPPSLMIPRLAITGVSGTCQHISDKLIGSPGGALEYIEGSCLMTPQVLARKHGLFPDYLRFIYWEDTDYSFKMRELGYTIATVDLPINHHKRSQTITTVLKPAEIQAHLAHNTEAMKQRWDFYFKRREMKRRILVRRLGAHGDVLLATPALWELRQKYPLADIHVQTKCPAMLHGLDWLSVVTRPRSWYDSFYDLDLAYEKRPDVHIVQAFADTLQVKVPARWEIKMAASPMDRAWAERVSRGQKIAMLHPGPTTWAGKNWPIQNWEELVKWLKGRGYLTLTVGDTHTPELGSDLHLAGNTTPQQLYALALQARLFVGLDSMPQHVASAANVPSVVLFGPTNPRCIIRPTHRIVAVQADRAKVPCVGEHGRRTKPVTQAPCNGECIQAVTLEMAQKGVERVEALSA